MSINNNDGSHFPYDPLHSNSRSVSRSTFADDGSTQPVLNFQMDEKSSKTTRCRGYLVRCSLLQGIVILICLILLIYFGIRAFSHKSDFDSTSTGQFTPATKKSTPGDNGARFRLPNYFIPSFYDLSMQVNMPINVDDKQNDSTLFEPEKWFTIDGIVKITIFCHKSVSIIKLNSAKSVQIHSFELRDTNSSQNDVFSQDDVTFDEELEIASFNLNTNSEKDHQYILTIRYTSQIQASLNGIYRAKFTAESGTEKWVMGSQMEPAYARYALPCFDEPNFKAEYVLSNLTYPAELSAYWNAEILTNVDSEVKGWSTATFGKTPKMSSYLLCFVVGPYGGTNATATSINKKEIKIRSLAIKDKAEDTQYATNITVQLLAVLENFFEFPYTMSKIDNIAIPSFSAGAMENWGLITYRESILLYNENKNSFKDKYVTVLVVGHELAHMWFGNVVTMSWWDDLWLNEGFASFMENYVAKKILPTFPTDEMTALRIPSVMELDALNSTHPIITPANSIEELSGSFDSITYIKARNVIFMLRDVIGENNFYKGVRHYIKKFQFKNTVHTDLWISMTENSNVKDWNGRRMNVSDFMDPWTKQSGFPLITVKKLENGRYEISQERFTSTGTFPDKNAYPDYGFNDKWPVPIWYKVSDAKFGAEKFAWLDMKKPLKLSMNVEGSDCYILNSKWKGWYRVNYDLQNWNNIIATMKSKPLTFSSQTRAQFLSDASTLAETGILEYRVVLELLNAAKSDYSFVPWAVTKRILYKFEHNLRHTKYAPALYVFVRHLVSDLYKQNGITKVFGESEIGEQSLQVQIVGLACSFQLKHCIDDAIDAFATFKSNCLNNDTCHNSIPINLRTTIYTVAIKFDDSTNSNWNFLYPRLKTELNEVELSHIRKALAYSSHLININEYLFQALDPDIMSIEAAGDVIGAISHGPIGRYTTWPVVTSHWSNFTERLSQDYFLVRKPVSALIGAMYTVEQQRNLEDFVATHDVQFVRRVFEIGLADLKNRIKWIDEYSNEVGEYLVDSNKIIE